MKTLLIDNYDSFTFNLFQLIAEVNGEEPLVVRNDETTWAELSQSDFDNIVISPGPGRPEREADFGICAEAIRSASVPLFGVCLGHQGLGHACGGEVVHAPEVMHGRLSPVFHDGRGLFEGIPQGFEVVRYHSLCVQHPLSVVLECTAWTRDGVVMGLRDRHRPRWGVQFHPESICTEYGRKLMENFRELTRLSGRPRRASVRPAPSAEIAPRPVPRPARKLTLHVRTLEERLDGEECFVRLFGDDPHAFWLDSSKALDERSRFSFMGGSTGPLSYRLRYDVAAKQVTVERSRSTTVSNESIFDYLQRELDELRDETDLPFDFNCGFVGYFGYELKADCDGSLVHRSSLPDAQFLFADRLVVLDHLEPCAYLLCLTDAATEEEGLRWLDETQRRLEHLPPLEAEDEPVLSSSDEPIGFTLSRDYETYLDDIRRCKECLYEGESYEICLTNKVRTDVAPDPLRLYRVVRKVNPAPFSAFLRYGDASVVSSSPERFLRVHRDRWVEAKPIKGTVRRGRTEAEDVELSEGLRASEKNRAENLMITDLLRNDLGIVCEIGSVHVPGLMEIETFETVHQMVSTIKGRLREDLGVADCVRACFPGGSMTGAPKKRTMEIIDDLEGEARGVYSGAIGYLGLSGGADLNIVIRTIVMDGSSTSIGMGGAIVIGSDPEEEYRETILKAEALMKSIVLCVDGRAGGAANGGDPEQDLQWALQEAVAGMQGAAGLDASTAA
ncbi:MAG TPA: aminodeoxychorismate synthase component I [Gaiellaceae bacterium]|jgi:para-aminobenzoate synthetase